MGGHDIVEIGIVKDGRLFDEIARTGDVLDIGPAFRRLVAVERGEAQPFDIERNAEAEHEHQQHRAEQGEGQADRVAAQFQRLAIGVAEQAAHAEGAQSGCED